MRRSVGESAESLSIYFGIAEQTVHDVCSGRSWSSAGGPITKRSILSDDEIVAMREMRASGASLREICETFGVGNSYVSLVCTGQKRKTCGGPISPKDLRSPAGRKQPMNRS